MIIEHDLLKKQKRRKNSSKVKVDLYAYATELYEELASLGIIERMQKVPQLGVIRVEKKLEKSRYDYAILQLYFHQLIKGQLQSQLEYTYNNPVKATEFPAELKYLPHDSDPTIGDLLQILVLAYSVGHFFNTFVASRAATIFADKKTEFYNIIVNASEDVRYRRIARRIMDEDDYQRFHLLNSLMVFDRCDTCKFSVQLAKELIYAYLTEVELDKNSKLHYVFGLFRSVRNVSYVAYDLQIAKTPLTIDLYDDKAILLLFRELLSVYNDNRPTGQLINSISKMLDDTVYNESSNAICYYAVSKRIVYKLSKSDWQATNYYQNYWHNVNSVFNSSYMQRRDYVGEGILKLTFDYADKVFSKKLLIMLEHINNSRVGYYDRHHGERTILVSIKKHCDTKERVAFRIFKTVISILKEIPNIRDSDHRFLLASKFFLFYFCGEKPLIIKSTVDPCICVLCNRGKRQRIKAVQALLRKEVGSADQRHEIEHLLYVMNQDVTNDTTISIIGSILFYDKNRSGQKLCEFDGMILYPMRKKNQVIFLEAKNAGVSARANSCLCKKFKKVDIEYDKENIRMHNQDAYYVISV